MRARSSTSLVSKSGRSALRTPETCLDDPRGAHYPGVSHPVGRSAYEDTSVDGTERPSRFQAALCWSAWLESRTMWWFGRSSIEKARYALATWVVQHRQENPRQTQMDWVT